MPSECYVVLELSCDPPVHTPVGPFDSSDAAHDWASLAGGPDSSWVVARLIDPSEAVTSDGG